MKIAQVSPLHESVPPKLYGGTERVVAYLTEALVEAGHEVTLYASGDSATRARLRPGCSKALRLNKHCVDPIADHILLIEKVYQEAPEFDVIHSHIDYLPFSLFRRMKEPSLTTLHGRLDIPDLVPVFKEFKDMPVVSISDAQRKPLPWADWLTTVYHGLPQDLYRLNEKPKDYLAFIGRVSPEKRVDHAIEIAARSGMPLKIAAKVEKVDYEYFCSVIKPLLSHGDVEFIGEIGEAEKQEFIGNAYALLFPIDWPEPFGLVMIEAMACGTPVIANLCGSVPEVMETGTSGYVVRSIEEAVEAVPKIAGLSRQRCREYFDSRFTAARMAADYEQAYETVIANAAGARPVSHGKSHTS